MWARWAGSPAAVLAGARRTDTSFERLRDRTNAADAIVFPGQVGVFQADWDALLERPGIAQEVPATTAVDQATTTGGNRGAAGPRLPDLTGTTLVVATRSEIGVVELDTGAVRSVELPGHGGYEVVSTTGDAAIVRGRAGVIAVPVAPDESPLLLADNRAAAWPVASERPGHVWLVTHSVNALQAAEVSVKGQATGRQFVVSGSFDDPLLAGVNGGLAIGAFGSLNHYDVDTGETTPVGQGHLLAASGETLARVSCEGLRCRLHLTDVRTGQDTEVHERAETLVVATRSAAFSPDGRWLVVGAQTVRGSAVALVDVADRRIAAVHRSRIENGDGRAVAFSADSRWLFQLDPAGDVLAHRLGTDETFVLEGVHPRQAIALAALATPASPAG